MARVTDEDVKDIITTDLDTSPHIQAANLMVTDRLGDSTLSAETLKEIERWLAAHFVSVTDPQLKAEKVGDATNTYDVGKLGENLKSTRYGLQAVLLDSTGVLNSIGRKTAIFETLCDDLERSNT